MSLIPSPGLAALCAGKFTVSRSSAELRWKGFLLERQMVSPEASIGDFAQQNMLAMVSSPIMRGEQETKHGLTQVRKTSGQVTVIPEGPVPEMRFSSKAELVYCSFETGFIERIAGDLKTIKLEQLQFRSGLRDKSLQQLFQLLITEFEAGNPAGTLYAESLAETLALRFLHLGNDIKVAASTKVSALTPNKLARVKDFVEASLDQDLTLDALADEVGYSRAHFLRMFCQSTGLTPHQYVMQRRIAHAEDLLAANYMGIAEIAEACGFSSQAHLTQAFRKKTGLTPAEFRRSL